MSGVTNLDLVTRRMPPSDGFPAVPFANGKQACGWTSWRTGAVGLEVEAPWIATAGGVDHGGDMPLSSLEMPKIGLCVGERKKDWSHFIYQI